MTTTHLFVELLVIGIGAFLALLLTVAGWLNWTPKAVSEWMALEVLFPVLAVVYVLGILVDRLADRLFDRLDRRHREEVFGSEKTPYFEARRTLVMDGENLWRDLEYVRSRLRICRGWAVNSALLLGSLWYYDHKTAIALPLGYFLILLLSLAIGCAWCWTRLNRKEYQKTQRLAEWLDDRPTLDFREVNRFFETFQSQDRWRFVEALTPEREPQNGGTQ